MQLTALLKYSLDRKTYASLLPPLAATLKHAGDCLPIELVWQLYRPTMERVPLPSPLLPAGKGKTQQAEDGEVQADAGAGAAAADPVVPALPTAAERGKSGVSLTRNVQAHHHAQGRSWLQHMLRTL